MAEGEGKQKADHSGFFQGLVESSLLAKDDVFKKMMQEGG